MSIRLNRIGEAVRKSTHKLCFEQKYEKISEFLSENFRVFVGEIYLKRSVFVMYLVADPEKERGLQGMGSVKLLLQCKT